MQRLLITFATLMEAQATLDILSAELLMEKHLYKFGQGLILITGIGAISTGYTLNQYITKTQEVWSYGIAGSLGKLNPGETVPIKKVSKHFSYPECLNHHARQFSLAANPSIELQEKGFNLICSDYPINHPILKNELGKSDDLVDMESYAIAYACRHSGKPLRMWRTVSDFADENASKEIRERLPELSERMAQHLLKRLEYPNHLEAVNSSVQKP